MRKIILTSLLLAGVLVSKPSFACECKYVQVPVKHHQHHHHHNNGG
jgi:hypothetical protein